MALTRRFFLYINKLMAIRKCPYCKAIIDEDALYCANCGTQLIFPENEEIEEPIPGDKITDEEFEKEEEGDTEKEFVETPKEDEVEWKKKLFLGEETDKVEEKEDELEKREEPKREEVEKEEEIGEVGEKAFDTADLDKIESAGEIDKEEIEGIISGLKKKEKEEGEIEEKKIETEEEIPPWVEQIKEAPPSDTREEKEEKEEEEIFQPEERFEVSEKEVDKDEEPVVDTGIGVPEEEQKGLPFVEEEGEAGEEVIDTEEKFQPPSEFSFKVKARAFDVFLITSLWLVTIWLASRLTEVSLFKLILVSSLPVFIFYLILLVSYFFLFLIFLGSTLGDRLFLPES